MSLVTDQITVVTVMPGILIPRSFAMQLLVYQQMHGNAIETVPVAHRLTNRVRSFFCSRCLNELPFTEQVSMPTETSWKHSLLHLCILGYTPAAVVSRTPCL